MAFVGFGGGRSKGRADLEECGVDVTICEYPSPDETLATGRKMCIWIGLNLLVYPQEIQEKLRALASDASIVSPQPEFDQRVHCIQHASNGSSIGGIVSCFSKEGENETVESNHVLSHG